MDQQNYTLLLSTARNAGDCWEIVNSCISLAYSQCTDSLISPLMISMSLSICHLFKRVSSTGYSWFPFSSISSPQIELVLLVSLWAAVANGVNLLPSFVGKADRKIFFFFVFFTSFISLPHRQRLYMYLPSH